jgi:FtsP/CotA-like multicopper oxidase with cupredoxin domain
LPGQGAILKTTTRHGGFMSTQFQYSRRRFMHLSGLGLLAAASAPAWVRAMEMSPGSNRADPNFKATVEIDFFAQLDTVKILPGQPTRVFRYTGKLVSGPKETLTEIPDSYLGPIIRLQNGQKVRINFHNKLPEPSIIHWHGLHVPAEMDGHPMHAIMNGQTRVYEFKVLNRAGLYFYHPHTHEATATQVYQGLGGGIIVNDEEESKLGLPSGEYEIPIVIQDRQLDGANQWVYGGTMHDSMVGFYGDRILVNGRPNLELEVASRAYRLRFLNASNARIYKLGWSDGTPITVIGVDGGLLEVPHTMPYVMLAPGERLDVWADFTGRSKGAEFTMRSLPFRGVLPKMAEQMMQGGKGAGMGGMGGGGMGHGMMGGGMMGGGMGHGMKLPVGSDFPIFKVRVTREMNDSPNLPTHLSTIRHYRIEDVVNATKPIPIGISEGPMSMLVNGRPYAHNDFLPFERVPVNTVQLMEIFHAHGGGGGHGGVDKAVDTGADGHGAEASPKPSASSGEEAGMAGHAMEGGDMKGGGMGGMGPGMMGGMGRGMMGGGVGGMGHGMMGGGMAGMQHDGQDGGGQGMGGGMGMMVGMGGMGMMFSMAHPIHLHGEQFQVLSRTIGAEEAEDYATVKDGLVSAGWKDTVLVMPGERVRVIKPFHDFKGVFMYHCHNLEHEDMGMMREFLIE